MNNTHNDGLPPVSPAPVPVAFPTTYATEREAIRAFMGYVSEQGNTAAEILTDHCMEYLSRVAPRGDCRHPSLLNGQCVDCGQLASLVASAPEPAKPADAPKPFYPHTWDQDGERCTVCGDKDWMGGSCKPPSPSEPSGDLARMLAKEIRLTIDLRAMLAEVEAERDALKAKQGAVEVLRNGLVIDRVTRLIDFIAHRDGEDADVSVSLRDLVILRDAALKAQGAKS